MRLRTIILRVMAILLVAAVCALVSCETGEIIPDLHPMRAQKPTARIDLATPLANLTSGTDEDFITTCYDRWLTAYVDSRIIGVQLNDRALASFGPWNARAEFGTTDASEDGSLTEWADHYYITHDWSDYGKQILTMQPGDTITVNNRTFVVSDVCNYPKDSFYDEIVHFAGKEAVILQTCYPDSDENRIVYGN